MIKKESFFQNYFIESGNYKKNIKKTTNIFKNFKEDFRKGKLPILETYNKNYKFKFINKTLKKYSKFKNIIIIGMGGSILGTKTIYSFLNKKIRKKVFFFDNLDPNIILEYKKIKNLKNSCFIIVSKSGNTLETLTNLSIIFSKNLFKNKLVIITEIKDNHLMNFASKYKAELIEHKKFIGGRYSVMSEASMFPALLMGVNIRKLKNLKNFIKDKKFVTSLIRNVASIFTLYSKGFKNSVILNYDTNLRSLGHWYQQLTAESLGKKGKGINPILTTGPKDHHSLLQLYLDGPKDKFFTFFNSNKLNGKLRTSKETLTNKTKFIKNKKLNNILNAQIKATKNVFKQKMIPFREITFVQKNEEELGKIFTFFVLETILLAKLMKVNPFDQPAVERVKIETQKFLN